MQFNNPRFRGILEISIASVGFGFLGVFGKLAFQSGLNIGDFLSYRFSLAALLLWIFLLLFKPEWVKISKRNLLVSALLGILGYALFSTLYFTAIEGVSITLAAMLLYTYPFWVNVFSHFFTHDKISVKEGLCLLAASVGLVLLLWGQLEVRNFWAFAAGLGSGITYAIYVLLTGKLLKNVRPISSSLYVITFAALSLSLFHRPHYETVLQLSTLQASTVLGIALICTIMPLTLVAAGLQKLKSTEVALLTMIEPVTAALMGVLIFHESLSLSQLFGALIIAGALVFVARKK